MCPSKISRGDAAMGSPDSGVHGGGEKQVERSNQLARPAGDPVFHSAQKSCSAAITEYSAFAEYDNLLRDDALLYAYRRIDWRIPCKLSSSTSSRSAPASVSPCSRC